MIVERQGLDLVLHLASNEALGVLDTGYLEDYYGTDSQLTLYHLATGVAYPVAMVETAETPSVPHDQFEGSYPFELLPDGDYEIYGRLRDVAGNYVVLGTVAHPYGGESVIRVVLTILSDGNVEVRIITLSFRFPVVSENIPTDIITRSFKWPTA